MDKRFKIITETMMKRPRTLTSAQDLEAISRESLQIAKLLESVLPVFFLCLRTLKVYNVQHPEVQRLAENVAAALRETMLKRKIINIDLNEKRFLLDDILISHGEIKIDADFVRLLDEHYIGRVSFREGVKGQDISGLLDLLIEQAPEFRPDELNAMLVGSGIASISLDEKVERPEDAVIDESEFQARVIEDLRQFYLTSLDVVREIQSELLADGEFGIWRLDFLIENLFFHVSRQHYGLLAALNLRSFASSRIVHPVNTCIIAAFIGAQLTKDGLRLRELMRAAFLHDCALLLDDDTSEYEAKHALSSAEIVDRNEHLEKLAVVCVYEHHEQLQTTPPPCNVFTSIISLASQLDCLIADLKLSPEAAVEELQHQNSTNHEPEVYKALANLFYPVAPGTLVRLADGEIALAVGGDASSGGLMVKVFADKTGNIIAKNILKTVTVWSVVSCANSDAMDSNLVFRLL